MAVVGGEVIVDGLLELAGAAMNASANLSLGERGEPALDLIESRGCRGEVHMEARVASHPRFDRRGLVGAIVGHHQVYVELRGRRLVDRAQEGEELLRPMTPMHLNREVISSKRDVGGRRATGRVPAMFE
jgi:hypothetical protein